MKYQSQKVALAYFYVAMALFAIQVLGGLLAGWIYVSPNTLSETLPFNIVRMIHTNALIVWLLLGFFGGTYYLLPEEAEREHLLGEARLYPARDPRRRHARRGGRLPLRHPRRARVPRAAALGQVRHPRRGGDLPLQRLADRARRAARPRSPASCCSACGSLSLLWIFAFINPRQPRARQDLLVVRRPPLGRGDLGAGDGGDPRLPDAEADRRRPRGDREVALRHRRAARSSPASSAPATTISGSARPPTGSGSARSSRCFEVVPFFADDELRLRHGLEGQARPPEQGGAALVARLLGGRLLRRRGLGLPAHAARGELLHPRHPGDRGARASRLLRRLRDAEPRDDHLRHADAARPRALQPGAQHGLLLADDERHGLHDLHAHLRRGGPDPPAAGDGHVPTWRCRTSSGSSTGCASAPGCAVVLGALALHLQPARRSRPRGHRARARRPCRESDDERPRAPLATSPSTARSATSARSSRRRTATGCRCC